MGGVPFTVFWYGVPPAEGGVPSQLIRAALDRPLAFSEPDVGGDGDGDVRKRRGQQSKQEEEEEPQFLGG